MNKKKDTRMTHLTFLNYVQNMHDSNKMTIANNKPCEEAQKLKANDIPYVFQVTRSEEPKLRK